MFFFFQAEDGIRDYKVTGVQTCALPILLGRPLLSGLGQCDEARALGHPLEDSRLVLHFPFLEPRVVAQALEVPVTGRAERRVPHAAHRDDAIAHQAYIPRSRCIAATRSTATM